ncbi:adenosylmethionine--8-amino-7-oxononanoate transaminase [Paraferrimonas sp. SM1919]|uniref:adenosylmethionine--8-amino-7-oxononanoate transaminase n=1 Tax=Paraferrimonas sp. SM1919 TaxID=2662263 RepID=UPI0013D235AA|nr:adenosylmethionine--8-amino-7-oxononanoate transaminase [Paraferrimonas sp. SM1919]
MDIQFDKDHLWHPYTSMNNPLPCYGVVSAKGVQLELENGLQVIDGMSSWWSVLHGYNHPRLNQAIKDQVDKVSHVMFGGLTHEPAIELGKKLVSLSPKGLDKVFLADSGSVAVEVALKMAIQYWQGRQQPQKTKILTVLNGYHGDTFGAMAVCDPENGMHSMFEGSLNKQIFAPAPITPYNQPLCQQDIDNITQAFNEHHNELAAMIIEPVVQGAGGMRIYSPEYLTLIRQLCDKHNVLLILDEIATGFGRTGKLFGADHAGICPDIMCVGKTLTGGYMTLAATLSTSEVASGISDSPAGVFMHGPTFMGNPLACSVANASLELIMEGHWQNQVAAIESQLKLGLAPAAEFDAVAEVRVLGSIGVLEMVKPVDMASLQKRFIELGVWVRPFGKLIYIMPPYCINEAELNTLIDALITVARES